MGLPCNPPTVFAAASLMAQNTVPQYELVLSVASTRCSLIWMWLVGSLFAGVEGVGLSLWCGVGCRWVWVWFLSVVVGAGVGSCGLAGVLCLGMVKRPCLDCWVQTRARVLGRVSDEVFYGAVQGLGEAVGHGDGHAFDGT